MPKDLQSIHLTPQLLLRAYEAGVFPMADDDEADDIYWVDPKYRGVLPLNEFHIPRRLARTIRSGKARVTINTSFAAVIAGCAARTSTWINQTILDIYTELHHMGAAHSVEVWQDDNLIGGLYGVSIGGAFCGESMFSRAPDASKIALVYLVARLKFGNYSLLDTQFTTEHLDRFGAQEISRQQYHQQLATALQVKADFNKMSAEIPASKIVELSLAI